MEHKQEFLIVGKTDIEKAVFLLREIDAFLSFNISPLPAQMTEMRKTIQEFTSHFPVKKELPEDIRVTQARENETEAIMTYIHPLDD